MEKRRKKAGLYIFYGALTVFLTSLILSFQDIGEIFGVLSEADPVYVLCAFAVLFLYAALYPLTVCILVRANGYNTSFGRSYAIGMTEHFFNGITPFATGGQPFQVYAFSKAGVRPADSTGVLLMNFIIHMVVTNLFAACSLFYYGRFATTSAMHIIAITGFSINFLVLAFMISLALSRRMRDLLSASARALCRIKLIGKLLSPRLPALDAYFDQVQNAFKTLLGKKRAFFSCFAIRALTMAVYYSLTFFILRALHVDVGPEQLFFVICGTSFAITMVVFVPTPGSSGGIEFAFEKIFSSMSSGASGALSYGGMLMWRLMSYYLLMAVSLAFYIRLEAAFSRESRRREAQSDDTDGGPDINGGAGKSSDE